MAFTPADLESLNAALASGELTVTVNGRTVTYRSVPDLLKARAAIESDLAAQTAASAGQGRGRTGYFTFATSRERY